MGLSYTITTMIGHKPRVSTVALRVHIGRHRLLVLQVFAQTNFEAGPGLGGGRTHAS
jgi:hypothetical protein